MTKSDGREYILVIEDEDDIARALLRDLHRAGYHATVAKNIDDVFSSLEERTPDVVVVDGSLPVVGGVEICQILRGKHATRKTPILFLTEDNASSQRLAASGVGADVFMAKPYRAEELVGRVQFLLAHRRGSNTPS
jgi:DNA-binding response OmpR family regulator